jgi:flagellar biosynthetic protein FliP
MTNLSLYSNYSKFILALALSCFVVPSALFAQETVDEEIRGFEDEFETDIDDFKFDMMDANDELENLNVDTQPLKPGAARPGSVESAVHFAQTMEALGEKGKLAPVLRVAFMLTMLTLLPAVLLTMTSFTRIVIVFSFVRRAMTLQTLPPNQIVIGLSLFLTYFIMAPTLAKLNTEAIQPMMSEDISEVEAIGKAANVMRGFMMRFTREADIVLFVEIAGINRPKSPDDVPMRVLLPAFVISELKTAFQMGFVIFLPFLVIDIVIATVLTAMGMFMLPPPMISIPFKILLFVLVDGWGLIIKSLTLSFM